MYERILYIKKEFILLEQFLGTAAEVLRKLNTLSGQQEFYAECKCAEIKYQIVCFTKSNF
ncbi:hypothetical protein ATZ36_09840 [Candidatus Endomicrobiellum trichonymphae]|uniref:Uncharacterized protein n=1 Tax=Endomicrobium trichonymphae TaxID=1408204 RepID=A0A1E5IG11_ENDTX|nr:hypothetical protein ATZ36_09840 [Candidatus Endomicrobium trichonymphae]